VHEQSYSEVAECKTPSTNSCKETELPESHVPD